MEQKEKNIEQFVGIYTETERLRKIKKEKSRLNKSLKMMDGDAKKVLENLINEAAFIAVALEEARKIISRDGLIETYQNGQNQRGMKKSSAVEIYDKLANTYVKIITKICEFLPDDAESDPAEELINYTMGYKK
jgi:regulator of replication initiation timing